MKFNDKEELYTALDFFMLRMPILPVEFFDAICFTGEKTDELSEILYKKIIQLSTTPSISETIGVASSSLANSIAKIKNEKDGKKKEQIIINFIKYLIRMSTRATPFGLFSGITTGKISREISKISLNQANNYRKKVRPDMEWLMSIIKKIENNADFVKQLKITTNNLADSSGERAYLAYNTSYGKKSLGELTDMESVSVRYTEAVKFAFEEAKNPIKYNLLLINLLDKYPDEKPSVIEDFLWQLFQSEFFISELRPPLMIKSPFDYVLNIVSHIDGFEYEKKELFEINDLIIKYEVTPIGEGMEIYLELLNKMKNIQESSSYLQVDLVASKNECNLNNEIAIEMGKVAKCLWRLSPEFTSSPEMIDYRNDFIEKYGVYREVPILELLDTDRGLGAPAGYRYPMSKRKLPNYSTNAAINLEKFIYNEIMKNKFDDKLYEIEITDEIIKNIEPIKPDYSQAPISMDLIFSINSFNNNESGLTKLELELAPNIGSFGAGKTFGRFVHFIDDECREKIREINKKEKEFYDDTIFAEIVFMPDSGRVANICISENYRDYEIAISTNSSKLNTNSIPLSDLLIGTTYDQFYIKSKALGKRIVIKTGHMLNLNRVPNVYRFLREISNDGIRNWAPLSLGSIENLPFIPRLKYRNTILLPATWNFSWEAIGEEDDKIKNDFNKFIEKINIWKEKWHVSRYVYLTEGDNRILLDLESELHLKILLSETNKLKNYSALSLAEANRNCLVNINGRSYNAEFVVPFIKNIEYVKKYQNDIKQDRDPVSRRIFLNKTSKFADDIRIKYPGSDWLYLKLYGNSKREEEFLSFRLREICLEIMNKNYAQKFFFMRYLDPEPHIRVRFNGDPNILTGTLLPEFNKFSNTLKNEGLLSKLVIDTYEREIERYGGPESIDYAEDVFYLDSMVVQELLFLKRIGDIKLDVEKLVIISIIDYLESFNLPYSDQLEFLSSLVDYSMYLDEFRKDRNLFMLLTNSNNDWESLRITKEGQIIREVLSQRHILVKRFIQKIDMLDFKGRLFNSKNDILASVIHLHCNRFIGTNRMNERKLMTLARHSLYNLKFFKSGASENVKKVSKKKLKNRLEINNAPKDNEPDNNLKGVI